MEREELAPDRLITLLSSHQAIGIDTSVFLHHFDASPRYLPLTTALLAQVQSGKIRGVVSTVTIMETTVRPWQLGRDAAARQYELYLSRFPNLAIFDVDRHVARRAAQLRASHRLRPADALQVATALVHGATCFVTNDYALRRMSDALTVIILDDLLDLGPGEE